MKLEQIKQGDFVVIEQGLNAIARFGKSKFFYSKVEVLRVTKTQIIIKAIDGTERRFTKQGRKVGGTDRMYILGEKDIFGRIVQDQNETFLKARKTRNKVVELIKTFNAINFDSLNLLYMPLIRLSD